MDEAPASNELCDDDDEWMPQLSSVSESVEHRVSENHTLPLPPIRDWGKDSAFWAHYRLLGAHIVNSTRKNQQMAGQYTLWGRPVRLVDVCGYVVAVVSRPDRIVFQLDDGSSIVPCILWTEPPAPQHSGPSLDPASVEAIAAEEKKRRQLSTDYRALVSVGALVRVRGDLSEYYYKPQVTARSVQCINDSNEEVLHWLDCIDLYKTCYSRALPTTSVEELAN